MGRAPRACSLAEGLRPTELVRVPHGLGGFHRVTLGRRHADAFRGLRLVVSSFGPSGVLAVWSRAAFCVDDHLAAATTLGPHAGRLLALGRLWIERAHTHLDDAAPVDLGDLVLYGGSSVSASASTRTTSPT